MDLVRTKVLVAILFFVIRLVFGLLPIKVHCWLQTWEEGSGTRKLNEQRHSIVRCYITLFQAFGGGVLFATCFLHMMLEVYLSVKELQQFGYLDQHYPYSQLIISMGFFFVYLVEEISHWAVSNVRERKRDRSPSLSSMLSRSVKIRPKSAIVKPSPVNEKTMLKTSQTEIAYIDLEKNDIVTEENRKNLENNSEAKKDSVDQAGSEEAEEDTISSEETTTDEEQPVVAETEKKKKTRQQVLRCGLIILALSFHSFFEGLSIGLQSSIANIWYLFIAVCIHSGTLLFGIGLEMVMGGARTKAVVSGMTLFAITSPLGVFTGLGISLYTDIHTSAKSIAILLLEGLSAGTILYIVFFEVLNREKQRRTWRLSRCTCILAGFALMAVMESNRVVD